MITRSIVYGIFYVATSVGVVPYLFASWLGAGLAAIEGITLGTVLVVLGLALFLWCVILFVWRGRGTQSPLAPPERFVVTGPYRFVRNPMLLGNFVVLLGESVLFESEGILVYALAFFIICHLILVRIEEPSLKRCFGGEYEAYLRHVPRWIPRFDRPAPLAHRTRQS